MLRQTHMNTPTPPCALQIRAELKTEVDTATRRAQEAEEGAAFVKQQAEEAVRIKEMETQVGGPFNDPYLHLLI